MALSNVISFGLGAFPVIREHLFEWGDRSIGVNNTYYMYTVSKLPLIDTELLYSSANRDAGKP